MKGRLFRLISIGTAEESKVTMLLCQSLFLGIFYGTFDVTAHSIFLSVFDEKAMARGYIVSGLAGIFFSFLYLRYHSRFEFRNVAVVNLLFITSVTLLLWILLLLNPAGWVLFIAFIMLGPLNLLAMLGFRGNLKHLFTRHNGSNLHWLAEGSLITGVIISCYAIPALLSFDLKTQNILLISAASAFTVTVIQAIPGSRFLFKSGEGPQSPAVGDSGKPLLQVFGADPLIRTIIIFTALSVMTAFFIQYSFMAVTRVQYPVSAEMARFLGLFTGSMMVLTLIIKFLVFPFLIRNFRLRTCLVIPPFLITGITVIGVVTGFVMGYAPAAAGFILFFMLLALSRFLFRSLKDSLESASVNVILQTFNEKIRYAAGSCISGIINEFAVLASGLVITGLGILSFVKLIHFSLVLIVIAVLWLAAAYRLYSVFRSYVRNPDMPAGQAAPGASIQQELLKLKSRFSAKMALSRDYFSLITGDLSSLDRIGNRWFMIEILDHADLTKDINLLHALKKIRSGTGIEKEIRQRSAEIISRLEHIPSGVSVKNDRIFNAIQSLAQSGQPQTAEVLKLLRDKNTGLRKIALSMIRKFRLTEIIPDVCECLGNPDLEFQAAGVLKSFGPAADESLRRFYLLSAGNINICRTILELLGITCSRENEEFLISLLWSGPRQIRETALKSLAGCNYRIREEDKDRILRLISDVIGTVVWDLSARLSIKKANNSVLQKALDKDIERWNLFLFNLLSITCDSKTVQSIRENIGTGTVESVNNALEMIDIVVDESLKPKLIPLFDTLPDKKKLNILHRLYPGEIPDYGQLIGNIINRDYNLLGVWIRACVIRSMAEIENEDIAQSLVAILFSPEIILSEETVRLFSRSGKEYFRTASDRIPLASRNRLEDIINGAVSDKALLYEKVKFFESLFGGLPEENLFFLAGKTIFADTLSSEFLPLQGGFILWRFSYKSPEFQVVISYENILMGITEQDSDSFSYILPVNNLEEYCCKFPEHTFEILNYIDEKE